MYIKVKVYICVCVCIYIEENNTSYTHKLCSCSINTIIGHSMRYLSMKTKQTP